MFPLCLVDTEPTWDALPVGTIVDFYDDKNINNHIFAQFQICYQKGVGLRLRLLSFENLPEPDDEKYLSFALYNGEKRIYLAINQNDYIKKICNFDGKEYPKLHHFSGEDLQGIFWGVDLCLDEKMLMKNLSISEKDIYKKDAQIVGNAYNKALADARFFPEENGVFKTYFY